MRPPGRSLSAARSLLCLTACLVLIGLISTSQAAAQATKPAGPATQSTATVPTKEVAMGLVFEVMRFNRLMLNGRQYHIIDSTTFYGIGGGPIRPTDLKRGDTVNVEYLTGGRKIDEGWSFGPKDRVLTSVRVVPKVQR